jgi:hypothetical protein
MKGVLPCEVCAVKVPKGGYRAKGGVMRRLRSAMEIGGVSEGGSRRRSWLSWWRDAMHQMREGIDDFIGDVGMNMGLRDGVISASHRRSRDYEPRYTI